MLCAQPLFVLVYKAMQKLLFRNYCPVPEISRWLPTPQYFPIIFSDAEKTNAFTYISQSGSSIETHKGLSEQQVIEASNTYDDGSPPKEPTQHEDILIREVQPSALLGAAHELFQHVQQSGNLSVAETAISLIQEALVRLSVEHPQRSDFLDVLACLFAEKFKHVHQPANLEKVIALRREVLTLRFTRPP
jgi:hypothetical protein